MPSVSFPTKLRFGASSARSGWSRPRIGRCSAPDARRRKPARLSAMISVADCLQQRETDRLDPLESARHTVSYTTRRVLFSFCRRRPEPLMPKAASGTGSRQKSMFPREMFTGSEKRARPVLQSTARPNGRSRSSSRTRTRGWRRSMSGKHLGRSSAPPRWRDSTTAKATKACPTFPKGWTNPLERHAITRWKAAWQGRRDSNPRPSVLETDALPTELHP